VVKRAERRLGPLAHGDDDLLVRRRGAVAGSKHTRHTGLAAGVDFDLAAVAQRQRAFQPVGIGDQTDLHKHAFKIQLHHFVVAAVLVGQAGHALAVAMHFGG